MKKESELIGEPYQTPFTIYAGTAIFAISDSIRLLLQVEFDFCHFKIKEFEWACGPPGIKTVLKKN
jgi:hypothetical protein